MKIAIFEDDHCFATKLETLIRQHTHHPTVINTGVEKEITSWINKTKEPVLYLLDIVACGVTVGFQIAQQIAEQQIGSLIVFITTYPKEILYNPIFKTKAFSIILKNTLSLDDEIKKTIDIASQALHSKCLYIFTGKYETLYIPYEKIYFIEAIKGTNKLCIHCVDGQYVIRKTLKSLLEQLAPFGFVRCHKSIIVNKANIRKKDKSAMLITFHNGVSCPFSYLMRGNLS